MTVPMLPQNLRYTLRILGRNPGFTAVAILSLALGIGANTAIFTLINALLLRSLPVPHPEQLVELFVQRNARGKVPFSFPMFRELERSQRVFGALIGWTNVGDFNVELSGELSRRQLRAVSGNYYSELGAVPHLGRLISPEDADPRAGATFQVAVLGYEFWRERFGAAPDVVGSQLLIQGQPFTIIGVTRKWFPGITPGEVPEITVPLTAYPHVQGEAFALNERSFLWVHLTGRLREGVTLAQARAQLQSFWADVILATAPTDSPGPRRDRFLSMGVDVAPQETGFADELRREYSRPLFVLLGLVGLILLLACLNLANVLLARAVARSQELAVRVALGASRWSLMRQVLSESLAVSFAGAVAGLALAYWGSGWVVTLMNREDATPIFLDLRPDLRVLGVALAAAIFTGLLAGLAPAWRASRQGPGEVLQQSARGFARGTGSLGKLLIIAQVALSLVLLVGAALLVRTLQKLSALDLGFDRESLLELELNARPSARPLTEMNEYRRQLLDRISSLPGVRFAAFSSRTYPAPDGWRDSVTPVSEDPGLAAGLRVILAPVSPGFFPTLGVRLRGGRDFSWDDDQGRPAEAIVSRNLAALLFPSGNAIGQRIRFGVMPDLQSLEIVGIVEDARIFDPRAGAAPVIYVPFIQHANWANWNDILLIRGSGAPGALKSSAAHKIETLGREYVSHAWTVTQLSGEMLLPERILAILSGFFAVVALLLASIGLYGLMSYTVTRRTREIGIRAALGAQKSTILCGVLRESLLLAIAGLAIGIPCALAAVRLIATLLYGISPSDPLTLAVAAVVLLAAALLAGFLPARRAASVDPIVALRAE